MSERMNTRMMMKGKDELKEDKGERMEDKGERLKEGECVSVLSIAGSGPGRRETAD